MSQHENNKKIILTEVTDINIEELKMLPLKKGWLNSNCSLLRAISN